MIECIDQLFQIGFLKSILLLWLLSCHQTLLNMTDKILSTTILADMINPSSNSLFQETFPPLFHAKTKDPHSLHSLERFQRSYHREKNLPMPSEYQCCLLHFLLVFISFSKTKACPSFHVATHDEWPMQMTSITLFCCSSIFLDVFLAPAQHPLVNL